MNEESENLVMVQHGLEFQLMLVTFLISKAQDDQSLNSNSSEQISANQHAHLCTAVSSHSHQPVQALSLCCSYTHTTTQCPTSLFYTDKAKTWLRSQN